MCSSHVHESYRSATLMAGAGTQELLTSCCALCHPPPPPPPFHSLSLSPPCAVESSKPVDLSALHDQVRMGQNAATVLATELPMMRATPVSYLSYGPFGSFAPVYDSAFATLSKLDSDLLLSSYGSELGVSYAHR